MGCSNLERTYILAIFRDNLKKISSTQNLDVVARVKKTIIKNNYDPLKIGFSVCKKIPKQNALVDQTNFCKNAGSWGNVNDNESVTSPSVISMFFKFYVVL